MAVMTPEELAPYITTYPELRIGYRHPFIITVPKVEPAPNATADPLVEAIADRIDPLSGTNSIKISAVPAAAGRSAVLESVPYRERGNFGIALYAAAMERAYFSQPSFGQNRAEAIREFIRFRPFENASFPELLLAMYDNNALNVSAVPGIAARLEELRANSSPPANDRAMEVQKDIERILGAAGRERVFELMGINDPQPYSDMAQLYLSSNRDFSVVDHWLIGRIAGEQSPDPRTVVRAGVQMHARSLRDAVIHYDGSLPITFDPEQIANSARDELTMLLQRPEFYSRIAVEGGARFHVGVGPNIAGLWQSAAAERLQDPEQRGGYIDFGGRNNSTLGMSYSNAHGEHWILLSTGPLNIQDGRIVFDHFRFTSTQMEESFHKAEELTLITTSTGERKSGRALLGREVIQQDLAHLTEMDRTPGAWDKLLSPLSDREREFIERGLDQEALINGICTAEELDTMSLGEKLSRNLRYILELPPYQAEPQESQNAEHLAKYHVLLNMLFKNDGLGIDRTDLLRQAMPNLHAFYANTLIPAMDAHELALSIRPHLQQPPAPQIPPPTTHQRLPTMDRGWVR